MSGPWRLGKCWQDPRAARVVWQLQAGPGAEKGFLVIEDRQGDLPLRIARQKDEPLTAATPLIAQLRKERGRAAVPAIWRCVERGEVWLPLGRESAPCWYLRIFHRGAFELSLIDPERVSRVRTGAKGTFTRRKAYDDPMPADGLPGMLDIRPQLLAAAATKPVSPERAAAQAPASAPEMSPQQREWARRLKRRLRTLDKAAQRMQGGWLDDDAFAALEADAEALKAHLHLLQPGLDHLTITREGGEVGRIPVEPELSPGKNLDRAYHRVRRARRARTEGPPRYEKAVREKDAVAGALDEVRAGPVSEERWQELERELGMVPKGRTTRARAPERQPWSEYRDESGLLYRVGKGPADNDRLTKSARANDYWFHVVEGGGAHVLLAARDLAGGVMTPRQKEQGAMLALHFSRLREERAGEVYVTQRRHLKKRKGLPPGLWLVERSEVIYHRYDESAVGRLIR